MNTVRPSVPGGYPSNVEHFRSQREHLCAQQEITRTGSWSA
jgi:hypothetical protein